MPTAILSAVAAEQRGLIDELSKARCVRHAGRDFWLGELHGRAVVLALSRIGKVAAATTATTLIERFQVQRLVFTGVAGGLGAAVQVGDVVVGSHFLQHDLDASPLFPRFEVPLYGCARFSGDPDLTQQLLQAASVALPVLQGPRPQARLHHGLIVTGDRFVASAAESRALCQALPDALAVEMEGAAVAQVCHDYALPFAAVRTISDRADDDAHQDFHTFVRQVACAYTRAIIVALLAAAAPDAPAKAV